MKPFKSLKQYNIKLSYEEYENIPVIVASTLPSNYESVLPSIICILEKLGVSYKFDIFKNLLIFKHLPSQYLGLIKSYVDDDYNSGFFL